MDGLAEKMIRRHPHVFSTVGNESTHVDNSDLNVTNAADLKTLWEKVKDIEKQSDPSKTATLLEKALKKKSLPFLRAS
jgi:uncharacterized protein YabN with tetrapyrrole methylase and pyrophosphatase domain